MSEGRTLQLLFGDFDIESSPGCGNGSLKIADRNGDLSLGKVDENQLYCLRSVDAIPHSLSQQRHPPSCLEVTNLTARKKYSILFSAVVIISSDMFLHVRSFLRQYFCCTRNRSDVRKAGGNAEERNAEKQRGDDKLHVGPPSLRPGLCAVLLQ